MIFREYNPDKDMKAVARIWREIGWIEEEKDEKMMEISLQGSSTVVAEVNGEAEVMVKTTPGTLRYLNEEINATFVTGVATSRVARKSGWASRLTAHALAQEAAAGMELALLGIFDQGYYNQLGFGNGSYEHWCVFDPADLNINIRPRLPARITPEDWRRVHHSRLSRLRRHGACSITPSEITQAEMMESNNGFGLGYYGDQSGALTHHLWCSTTALENGPYTVEWMTYQAKEEFLELLALLKSFSDQIYVVKLREPPGVQLQDLLIQPFRARQITAKSEHENRMVTSAYWQVRILNLDRALKRTHLPCETVRFNLTLTDPIKSFLSDAGPWRGIAGDYILTIGRSSSAESGKDSSLSTLTASINAFTRLWLGVRSASELAWTDELTGPQELLARLDALLRLPTPLPDWDF
ncbi:sterol carrier protein domain-containing protein [Candidatus Acetothermia bacterium]|nr:sterol carrier protein domain-containing protein [Candidatus Acetothermia bacterium]MCI2427090.1 sterol carrier protein domain-containing protein [Candidatus Acetothermia bacterium]MCI2428270.1 sterol carrier protein domain-containing protein [Candidatus Acetothermia bacterium]